MSEESNFCKYKTKVIWLNKKVKNEKILEVKLGVPFIDRCKIIKYARGFFLLLIYCLFFNPILDPSLRSEI